MTIKRLGMAVLAAQAMLWSAGAATYYVAPVGSGSVDGSSWANAYGLAQLQTAVNAASSPGDAIVLRYGIYSNSAAISMLSRPGLTLQGGYEGVGSPGDFTNVPTVLARNTSVASMRIVYGSNSTVTLDRLTITNGYMGSGAGVYLTNCNTIVTNCVIVGNLIGGVSTLAKGGGIFAATGTLTVVDSSVRGNGQYSEATYYGVGLYAENASVTLLRTSIANNSSLAAMGNSELNGGGVYLKGGNAWVESCRFETNAYNQSRSEYGGAFHATGVRDLAVTGCVFRGNGVTAYQNVGAFGGAVYVTACANPWIVGCDFDANYLKVQVALPLEGADLWLSGGTGLVSDCTLNGTDQFDARENILVDNASNSVWTIRNTTVKGLLGSGIRKKGFGALVLTNSLVQGCGMNGVQADSGTVVVAQCTLANNGGWGVTNNRATVTLSDSILWGNLSGGVSSTNGATAYTCSQETLAGTGNFVGDPLFVAGYYLSSNGLPAQSANSPCRDAGSMTAANAALDGRTTRTDGGNDDGQVDLGYHAASGFAGSFANLTLYVNVVSGSDVNDGWTGGTAVKTIKRALELAIDGSTINIATGRYTWSSGEVFPLNLQAPNLTLKGAGPAFTFVDPSATNQAFVTSGRGSVWIEGLTVTNGRAAWGAGLYLPGCRTTVTNCLFINNLCNSGVLLSGVLTSRGGGIYAKAGTLTVMDSRFQGNGFTGIEATEWGGSICAEGGVAVTLNRVTVTGGASQNNSHLYGAGVHLNGGSAWISDCAFVTNIPIKSNARTWQGGGLYATGVGPLTVTNCAFRGNRMFGSGAGLYVTGSSQVRILGCVFDGNYLDTGNTPMEGGALWLTGSGVIADSLISGGNLGATPEAVFINNGAADSWTIRDSRLSGSMGFGIRKRGAGSLVVSNCLVRAFPTNGLIAEAGSVLVANSTLAQNLGWGLANSGAVITVVNSIAWGNGAGGISSTNGPITYTCSQEALAGAGNQNADPLLVAGSYLSVNGLLYQTADSPCIDAGSMTATAAGLDAKTTRTDGAGDAGTVDLGYHAPTGSVVAVSNLNLYVNVVTGNDGNDGFTAGSPLKTITAALARTIDNSTIFVATGRYFQASGEVFPLTSRTLNLFVIGADRATTILDATGTNRVFSADGRGQVWFEGLTIANGRESQCAGINLPSCLSAVVTNCLFLNNRIPNATVNSWGGAIATVNGRLIVVDSEFRGNGFSQYMTSWGGALYSANADVTIRNSLFATNFLGVNSGGYGAAVYLSGGSALLAGCAFNTNYMAAGYNHGGGALYGTTVAPLIISNCTFTGNYLSSFNGVAQGGALYINGCKPLLVSRCTFAGNRTTSVNAASEGGSLLLNGSALWGTISECDITGEPSGVTPETVSVDTATTNSLEIRNTVIRGVVGVGVNKKGTGGLVLTNCLIYSFAKHAVLAGTGTVTVANSTLADNGGWGVTNAIAVLNVANSIVWGNQVGAIASTNGSIAYTCATNIPPGSGNFAADPRWVAGYYLSVNGLPYQAVDSPCINAGSASASALGLDTRTTRTDGSGDSSTVDLGYHAPTSAVVALSNMVLYVNVVTGSDANNGWAPDSPLKTITAALGKTISGSTIYVATGRYYQASGEVFPLASRQANLTVIGANRDTTLLDATATNRVFSADGRGAIWLEGLTFTNGNALAGAGIFLPGCRTVITNCLVAGNRYGIYATVTGCGIYALNGTLDVLDSVVLANGTSVGMSDVYGAGIYAAGAVVTLRRVVLSANYLKPNNISLGAGVYLSGGSALVDGCAFLTNRMDIGYGHQGVGLYSTAVNPLMVRNSSFVGNYSSAGNGISYGAGLASVSGPVTITNCTFLNNHVGTVNSAARGGALMLQDAGPFLIASSAFTGNIVRASTTVMEGGVMFLTGNGLAGAVSDCTIASSPAMSNAAPENVSVAPGISNVIIRNTVLAGGRGSGIGKYANGSLTLTNCLIQSFTNHGIFVATGSVVVANTTLVNNRGWGLMNTTNALTVRNSIAWGNTNGGFNGSGNAITYTCSQESQAGTGNKNANPLFVATNDFRLLKASPGVNAGLNDAGMLGMLDLAGNARIIGKIVDMGAYENTTPPVSGTVIMVR